MSNESEKIKNFFNNLGLFVIIISCLYTFFLFWLLILNYWNIVTIFFKYFDSSSVLQNFFLSIFLSPNIQNITIVIIILVTYFYIFQSIKDKGVIFYEFEGIEGKYFITLPLVLAIAIIVLIPFLFYLFINNRLLELFTVFGVLIFGSTVVRNILLNYLSIVTDFDKISEYRNLLLSSKIDFINEPITSIKLFAISGRNDLANAILALTFFFLIYSFYFKFSLLSIIYIEISLIIWYFTFCTVTKIPKGPVNIFLIGSQIIFNDVYIIEDSSKGYVSILIKDEKPKKIMTTSILFLEPSKIQYQTNSSESTLNK